MKKLLLSILVLTTSLCSSQSGAALNFDGINDYVNLPNVGAPFNVTSAHIKTFQVWFKNTTNQGAHVRIFSTGTANWSTGIWFGYAQSSPYLRFELSDGVVPNGCAITGTTNIRGDNQWHQATGVINGSVAILYLDAVLEGTVNISSEGTMNSAGSVHIGNSYDNEGSSYFQGNIDELRVWEKVLCQQEIMTTMNCELTGSETGLVAYYKFNQGLAGGNNTGINTLPDLTSNSNTGVLTNMNLTTATSNWVSPGGVTSGSLCPVISPTVCSEQTGINSIGSENSSVKIINAQDHFEIISEGSLITEINVYDVTGRSILKDKTIQKNNFLIDLNSQSKGLYFIEVRLTKDQKKIFKVTNR